MSQVLGRSEPPAGAGSPRGPGCEGRPEGGARRRGPGRGEPPPGCARGCQCHAREREEVPGPRGARAESRRSVDTSCARPPAALGRALWRRRRRAREPNAAAARVQVSRGGGGGGRAARTAAPGGPRLSQPPGSSAALQRSRTLASAPSRAPACPAAPESGQSYPHLPAPRQPLLRRSRFGREASMSRREVSRGAITLSPTLCPGRGVPASVFSRELTASSSEACTPPRAWKADAPADGEEEAAEGGRAGCCFEYIFSCLQSS